MPFTRNQKVVITIEDVDDRGTVRVTMTPKASEIIAAIKAGQDTPAHGYAMGCINVIQAINKESEVGGRGIVLPSTMRGARRGD